MTNTGTLEDFTERLRRLPGIRQLRAAAFNRQFETNTEHNLFRGVFATAAEALASAPAARPTGYDNVASSELYLKRLNVDDHDYPAMFWLQLSLNQGMSRITDLGGSVGIKFYAFSKFMTLPPEAQWLVIDVPAVVDRGRSFANEMKAGPCLRFSDDIHDMQASQILYASGVLQYMPETFGEMLGKMAHKPLRVIINTAAIHPHRDFFTLNSIGTAYCAYRVQSRQNLLDEMTHCGYGLLDEWLNRGKQMILPLHPEASLRHYAGFCFERILS